MGAKYTIFFLETQIQIYTRNGQDLFDIIMCEQPNKAKALLNNDNFLMLATITKKQMVEIRDYSMNGL